MKKKKKRNIIKNSLPAFSKRVAKLSLQLHLTIDLPFSTVELRFTVTLSQAKLLPCRHQCFPCGLYRNYSNYGPLFLIIQFFVFSTRSIKIVGWSGPRNNKLIWNGLMYLYLYNYSNKGKSFICCLVSHVQSLLMGLQVPTP